MLTPGLMVMGPGTEDGDLPAAAPHVNGNTVPVEVENCATGHGRVTV